GRLAVSVAAHLGAVNETGETTAHVDEHACVDHLHHGAVEHIILMQFGEAFVAMLRESACLAEDDLTATTFAGVGADDDNGDFGAGEVVEASVLLSFAARDEATSFLEVGNQATDRVLGA